jgi:hypothetical protein
VIKYQLNNNLNEIKGMISCYYLIKLQIINYSIISISKSLWNLEQVLIKHSINQSIHPSVRPHYRLGIGGHLTVNRTKENNRVHSITIE